MGDATNISWAQRTMNFWIGCSEAGPGCDHCYARTMMQDRYHRAEWGPGKPRVRTTPANWNKALKWDREAAAGGPSWVFAQSLSDFFDNEIPQEWRLDAWRRIDATKNLRWMLLSKRVSNIGKMLPPFRGRFSDSFPHVGIMITVCNQEEADRDVPRLIRLKITQGFAWIGLSIEPMLGPIVIPGLYLAQLDFVIAGGESGAGARPMHPDWPRRLRDDCAAAGVPYHFKQWGEFGPTSDLDHPFAELVGFDPEFAVHECGFDICHAEVMARIGTKNSGHLLDGKEHRAMPTVYDAPPDPIFGVRHVVAEGASACPSCGTPVSQWADTPYCPPNHAQPN